MPLTRRAMLLGASAFGGLIGLGALPEMARAAADQLADRQRYGWQPDTVPPRRVTGGAALHVSPEGDDGADGSERAPLRRLQTAVDRLARAGSGTLFVHGGVYREEVSLSALRGTPDAPYHIRRYDDAPVTVSAADVVTGWRPATAQDVTGLGITPDNLYTVRVAKAVLTHDTPFALNLHEAGTWCSIATDRADDTELHSTNNWKRFHVGNFLVERETEVVQAIQDARLAQYPTSAFRDVRALIYGRPNVVRRLPIIGVDAARGLLQLQNEKLRLQYIRKQPMPAYALQNAPWAMEPGRWFMRDAGDEIAIFFWPRDPAHLDSQIEISTRPTCIDLGRATHVTLEGLTCLRAAGKGRFDSACVRRRNAKSRTEGIAIINCRLGQTQAADRGGYGALFLHGVTGVTLERVTIDAGANNFGFFLAECDRAEMHHMHVHGVSKGPLRLYGVTRSVMSYTLFEHSGRDAHANKMSVYEGCDRVLFYALRCRDTGGYATFQKASRICYAFCEFDCDVNAQGRALVSQNNRAGVGKGGADGSGDPVAGATNYYWNNSLLVPPREKMRANSLSLGPKGSSQHHAVYNNVLNGGGFATIYTKEADSTKEIRSHNVYSDFAYWQSARYGWALTEGEAVGSHLRRYPPGRDMRALIRDEIAPLFPSFTGWERDIDGNPVDWENAPRGCQVLG